MIKHTDRQSSLPLAVRDDRILRSRTQFTKGISTGFDPWPGRHGLNRTSLESLGTD